MTSIDIYLLREGDKVYVNNKKKTVTKSAKNDTICIDGEYRYFGELSKTKVKETGYANGIYAKLILD
jgi:hypothetical protein